MFEDRTYENIMEECLAGAPPGIDIRPGSIFYDAVAPAAFKIAQFYADLSSVFDLVVVATAVDEYLDERCGENAVYRLPATPALYEYIWSGASQPAVGGRFFSGGLFFILRQNEKEQLYLESEEPGAKNNDIIFGTPAVPAENTPGLEVSKFGSLITPGADSESDDAFRTRFREKIAGSAENGNRQHYKTWCESVAGVGRAKITPLFAGENTVLGIIIGADGKPAVKSVTSKVQSYIDPITLNKTAEANGKTYTVGDGLGNGVANIGAHFVAVAPEGVPVNISFKAEIQKDISETKVQADAKAAITSYFKNLALTVPEDQSTVVRVSAISSIIYNLPGVLDFSELMLNGKTSNIELTDLQIAVLGEVTVDASV